MPRNVTVLYTCDVCGVALDEADAYAFAVSYAKPGREAKAITCPDEQHYGCTPEHAAQAAKACIDHLEAARQAKAEGAV